MRKKQLHDWLLAAYDALSDHGCLFDIYALNILATFANASGYLPVDGPPDAYCNDAAWLKAMDKVIAGKDHLPEGLSVSGADIAWSATVGLKFSASQRYRSGPCLALFRAHFARCLACVSLGTRDEKMVAWACCTVIRGEATPTTGGVHNLLASSFESVERLSHLIEPTFVSVGRLIRDLAKEQRQGLTVLFDDLLRDRVARPTGPVFGL